MPGETGQAFDPAEVGNYAVEITKGTCTDTSACEVYLGGPEESAGSGAVTLFPNPANHTVTVSAEHAVIQRVEILSVDGQLQWSETGISQKQTQMDIRHLPEGIYLIRTTLRNGAGNYNRLVRMG